jgi:cyclopropane fatty-acyl-phospholipid synthase-like methyltransferase
MKSPFDFLMQPDRYGQEFKRPPSFPAGWPPGFAGAPSAIPEHLERTMRDWLNMQRDFAAAYTRWLEQLREARTPVDFMHAQQAGLGLWTQWVTSAMRALATEAMASVHTASSGVTESLKAASVVAEPSPPAPPKNAGT